VQDADTVILLENGSVSAQGQFKEVEKNSPLVARFVELMRIN